MANMSEPYTHEDYQAVNDRLRSLNEARAALEKAQGAGIDCAEWPSICQHMIERFESLKSAYFPNKP